MLDAEGTTKKNASARALAAMRSNDCRRRRHRCCRSRICAATRRAFDYDVCKLILPRSQRRQRAESSAARHYCAAAAAATAATASCRVDYSYANADSTIDARPNTSAAAIAAANRPQASDRSTRCMQTEGVKCASRNYFLYALLACRRKRLRDDLRMRSMLSAKTSASWTNIIEWKSNFFFLNNFFEFSVFCYFIYNFGAGSQVENVRASYFHFF